MTASATTQLGRFVASTKPDAVPPSRLEQAKVLLLDSIGCAFLGRDYRLSNLALRMAEQSAKAGPSTFWLDGSRGSIEECAFVNALLIHNPLIDDTMAWSHPACNVMPAAVAVGEAERSSGIEVLAAIALGYEVQFRIAPDRIGRALFEKGYHGSAAPGSFGSATVAASLMNLSAEEAANALAIAASTCVPALEEPITRGTSERSLHMAANTKAGIQAAQLARIGFEGASTALEGPLGFYSIYVGEAPPDELLTGLGQDWIAAELRLKKYPTAFRNTFAVYSAEKIKQENTFDASDIEAVRVRILPWGRNTGYAYGGPFATVEQALIATKFAVAVTLRTGTDDFAKVLSSVGDPVIDELAARTTTVGEEPATGFFGSDGKIAKFGEVEVDLRDGRTITANAADMPDTDIWPDWEAEVKKFHGWTASLIPDSQREAIVSAVDVLASSDSVADLVRLLR